MTPEAAAELISEFAELADQILVNPAVVAGLPTTLSYVADEPFTGRGRWSMAGPNEIEMAALLLHLRNVTQPGSDLRLDKVLDALALIAPEPDLLRACAEAKARLVRYEEVGFTTENGKPVRPHEIVRLILYSSYHHRDLSKRRQLKAMHPFVRMAGRMEFVEWVRNQCSEVAYLRYRVIHLLQNSGYLSSVPRAPEQVEIANDQPSDAETTET